MNNVKLRKYNKLAGMIAESLSVITPLRAAISKLNHDDVKAHKYFEILIMKF